MRAIKADDVIQTVVGLRSILDALEVSERVVLLGIGLHHARGGKRRERGEVCQVGGRAVAIVDAKDGTEREALLVALPRQSCLRELVTNRLAFGRRGRHRLHAIDIGKIRKLRQSYFVPSVNGWSLSVLSCSGDWADISRVDRNWRVATAVIGVHNAGDDIGRASRATPGWSIVAADTEVGAANDFEVICQAWMADREVVLCVIDLLVCDETVEVRLVGIIEDLQVAVVLHHDHARHDQDAGHLWEPGFPERTRRSPRLRHTSPV